MKTPHSHSATASCLLLLSWTLCVGNGQIMEGSVNLINELSMLVTVWCCFSSRNAVEYELDTGEEAEITELRFVGDDFSCTFTSTIWNHNDSFNSVSYLANLSPSQKQSAISY